MNIERHPVPSPSAERLPVSSHGQNATLEIADRQPVFKAPPLGSQITIPERAHLGEHFQPPIPAGPPPDDNQDARYALYARNDYFAAAKTKRLLWKSKLHKQIATETKSRFATFHNTKSKVSAAPKRQDIPSKPRTILEIMAE